MTTIGELANLATNQAYFQTTNLYGYTSISHSWSDVIGDRPRFPANILHLYH